jgi:hypothetical protein
MRVEITDLDDREYGACAFCTGWCLGSNVEMICRSNRLWLLLPR